MYNIDHLGQGDLDTVYNFPKLSTTNNSKPKGKTISLSSCEKHYCCNSSFSPTVFVVFAVLVLVSGIAVVV